MGQAANRNPNRYPAALQDTATPLMAPQPFRLTTNYGRSRYAAFTLTTNYGRSRFAALALPSLQPHWLVGARYPVPASPGDAPDTLRLGRCRHLGKHLARCRVLQIRTDLRQRDEHERPLRQTRVRYRQLLLIKRPVVKEQDVQVYRPRPPALAA